MSPSAAAQRGLVSSLLLALLPVAVAAEPAASAEPVVPAEVAALPLPTASISWSTQRSGSGRDGIAALHIHPPPGEHIGLDAPVRVALSVGTVEQEIVATGALLSRGLLFAAPHADVPVQAGLTLSLCADQGSSCRVVSVRVQGEFPSEKRGQGYALDVLPPAPAASSAHAPAPLDAVFARARTEKKPVLLDFTAVWCPPCQQLRAEVLEDPADAPELAGVLVAAVDVDRPESWTVKDRYKVGGYPTLVLIDADGQEIDRTVGYNGEADFKAWLSEAVGGSRRLSALPAPESLGAPEALALARRLAQVERPIEAGAYLTRAETVGKAEVEPTFDYHLTRLLLRDEPVDAAWLAAHAPPEQIGAWIWPAVQLRERDPGLVEPLRAAIIGALPVAPAAQAADLAQVLGDLAPASAPDEKRAWYGVAIQLTRARLTGDPAHDRGFWAGLIDTHLGAGDPAGARQLLDQAIEAYPEEFTWHHSLAGQLLEQGKPAEARAEAELAYRYGYGDNRLRAAERLARARAQAGDKAGALAFIDEVLQSNPRPPAELQVRTGRYLDKLQALKAELSAPPPPPAAPSPPKGKKR